MTSVLHEDATHYFPLLARETKRRCRYYDGSVVAKRESIKTATFIALHLSAKL